MGRLRIGQIGSNETVRFAVNELTRYLKMMDAQLTIDVLKTGSVRSDFSDVLWVGRDKTLSQNVPAVFNEELDDAIAISVDDGRGYITGTNDRSVLLAAYRFLRELGCIWFRPGCDGECIPIRALTQFECHVAEAASYRHRGVCIEGANSFENVLDIINYLPKVGMNSYFIQFFTPITFFERWYHHSNNPHLNAEKITCDEIEAMTEKLEEEITERGLLYHKVGHGWTCEPFGLKASGWDTNKQYDLTKVPTGFLAQVGGKRGLSNNIFVNTELCYSNPKVREHLIESVVRYCKENKHVGYVHFWLADGINSQCECAECAKALPSHWYVVLLNELDKRLTAEGIDTKIVCCFSRDRLWLQEKESVENKNRFLFMFAPVTRIYGTSYQESHAYKKALPPYQRNHIQMPNSLDENLAYLRQLQQVVSGDSFVFEYHLMWAHFGDPGYERCAQNLYHDIKDLRNIGLNGMISCQVQRCSFPTALPMYVMAQTLWNQDNNYDRTADAYYTAAYGADGPLVCTYLRAISEKMRLFCGPSNMVFLPKAEKKYYAKMAACVDYPGIKKIIADFLPIIQRNCLLNNQYQKEWDILCWHHQYVSQFVETLELRDTHQASEAEAAGKKFFDYVCQNELALQNVLDVYAFMDYLPTKLCLQESDNIC